MNPNLPAAYRSADLSTMPDCWLKEFEAEVADGNFLLGGRSLYLQGHEAEHAARHWIACLLLAGFKCYRITPLEAIRRADGKPVYGDDEDRAFSLRDAECVLLDDFFDPDAKALLPDMVYLLGWFLRELLRSGVTVIIASDSLEPDLGIYSDQIWNVVTENFEVIKNAQANKAADKGPSLPKRRKPVR